MTDWITVTRSVITGFERRILNDERRVFIEADAVLVQYQSVGRSPPAQGTAGEGMLVVVKWVVVSIVLVLPYRSYCIGLTAAVLMYWCYRIGVTASVLAHCS